MIIHVFFSRKWIAISKSIQKPYRNQSEYCISVALNEMLTMTNKLRVVKVLPSYWTPFRLQVPLHALTSVLRAFVLNALLSVSRQSSYNTPQGTDILFG